MDNASFCHLVHDICENLESQSAENPQTIAACRSGEDFEGCVVEAVRQVLPSYDNEATILYEKGSHTFPDIVISFSDGTRFGIEVKSSTGTSKSWKINGNSVLGSTKEAVDDIYIVFGKTAIGHQEFRYKRYEDSVSNVVVTHSPRYLIDLDIDEDETFFSKSGLSYDQLSSSEDPIGLITTYFKQQGLHAWWLAESTPATIRMFSDLRPEEQKKLIAYCFVHFPEVFSKRRDKYRRSAMWLVSDQSIVSSCLRDNFTASGKVDLIVNGTTYRNVPQIFSRLQQRKLEIIAELSEASSEQLKEDWHSDKEIPLSLEDRIPLWIDAAIRLSIVEGTTARYLHDLLSDLLR